MQYLISCIWSEFLVVTQILRILIISLKKYIVTSFITTLILYCHIAQPITYYTSTNNAVDKGLMCCAIPIQKSFNKPRPLKQSSTNHSLVVLSFLKPATQEKCRIWFKQSISDNVLEVTFLNLHLNWIHASFILLGHVIVNS